jgi:uncharacterized membrane protein YkvA (DUF1232 family)
MPWTVLISCVAGLLGVWLCLVACLWWVRPRTLDARSALRLLPDTVRLMSRLARDRALPRGARWRLWLLLGYLELPIDLIPDFVPVIGYADDAIIAVVVLRSVVRRAGPDVVRRNWPGRPDGLAAVMRLVA